MTQLLEAQSPQALILAADLLRQGDVIALPTDTVYGVAALAFNVAAVAKIYRLKARPLSKALPVFVPTIADLPQVCSDIPPHVLPLLERYWPGALTVILPAAPALPGLVTNHGPTVAVRIPDHPAVLDLLAWLKEPLAVTSANLSGQSNLQTAAEVKTQFQGHIPLVLDGGPSISSLASTVLDLTQSPPRILRQGALQISEIELRQPAGE